MGLSSNIVGGVSTLTAVVVVSVVAKWLASVRERNHNLQMAQLRTQLDAMVQRANAAQYAPGIQNDVIRAQNRRIHLAQKSQFVPRPARERSHKFIDIFRAKLTASNNVLVELSNDDRISLLPDGVLCHILSFLPTKFSVRTSVLSTRWKQLFTFVPNLHFEFDSSSTIISFMHFVNSIFMCYNISRMNKFRFYFFIDEHVPENFPMASWMSAAIGRHVQEIDICLDCLVSTDPIYITLPLDLFTCKTLTILKLSGTFMVELPTSVCLPCLKKCEFYQVRFNDESARNLFQSCPVLEYLVLRSCCFGDDVEVLNISSPVLKDLIIVGSGDTYHLMLNLSNLLTFSYVGPASEKFLGMESSLKSVVHASIYYYPDSSTKDGAFAELLCSLCHVQVLVLTCQEFIHSGHSLPKFNNLTSLYLGIAPTVSLLSRLLLVMLDNSPRLQFLTICQGCDQNEVGENNYVLPEHVPECVSLHLKEVDLTFIGSDYERKLIKYFLKYANNLYWMRIKSELKWNEQLDISSAACRVIFS